MNAPLAHQHLLDSVTLPSAWRALAERCAQPALVTDTTRRITWANAAFSEVTGYSLEEALGRSPGELLQCEQTDPTTIQRVRDALNRGQSIRCQLLNRSRQGRLYWLDMDIHPFGLAGEAPRGFVALAMDMTAQHELQEREAAHARRLKALFDLSPLGLALFDMETKRPIECNAALSRINGFSRADILSGEAMRHVPDAHLPVREVWMASVRLGEPFGPLESVILHRDGHRVDVSMSGASTQEPGGRRMAWLMVQDISKRKTTERLLAESARRDTLTGLPNRNRLDDHLEHMLARTHAEAGWGFAVLLMDVDRFKVINESLGHDAGDSLLVSLAERLKQAVMVSARLVSGIDSLAAAEQEGWLIARFGGDEFAIVAPGLSTQLAAASFAEVVNGQLQPSHRISGLEIQTTVSIGIALAHAGTAAAVNLVRDADTAMYEAKRLGRRQYAFFDERMRSRISRALHIEEGLRHAHIRGQLRLVFQPIVDLETGLPTAAESLLRWTHPTLGQVPPDEFIAVAEETGQIVELGRWALFESCAAWTRMHREAPEVAPQRISVNLSRIQMDDGLRLLATVRAALTDTRMPPKALQLEITEREVMSDPDGARQLIDTLRRMGVRIAMDDFGTGSSSLACLREYAFDTVKIDKSFVKDLCRDAHVMAVAHATVSVIENLGMISVAEGVEDDGEVAALQGMGCRYGQGWRFGRPMDEAALLAMFKAAYQR
ncbi:MAG: putative bifunctional diguanylate cyclase/phosphodiesterase [Rubrivivax sp.]